MTDVSAGTALLHPRWRIKINGALPTGTNLVSGSLSATNYSKGDTFDARVAVDWTTTTKPLWFDPSSAETPIDIIFEFAMLSDGQSESAAVWSQQFHGILDKAEYNPETAEVHIEGRDYLALLLDTQIQQAWLNNTGTALLNTLITAAGLTPDVQLSGDAVNGQFWQVEHKRTAHSTGSRFRTAFDLARFIVDGEGCDMWAEGKTIKVRPFTAPSSSLNLAFQQPGTAAFPVSPVLNLLLERDLLIAKGVVVQVIGWDSRQRAKHVYVWSASGNGPGIAKLADAKGTLHTFNRPNLRMDKAQALAKQKYDEIVARQRTVSFEMAGDLTLSPRQSVTLSGTGTSWDTTLQVDSVARNFGEDGFWQNVTLRNRTPSEDTSDD